MSSIAYVTDEKMIEYHRLCGSQNINFWRLSNRSAFKDFRKGDLLFFYAHGLRGRTKGLVGYAHYDGSHHLSLKQMWSRYGTANGYDNIEEMQEAIEKAARDHKVPEKMNSLYLTNVVFFRDPVYPKDVGISINEKLESYTYLDKQDPEVTIRILRQAEKIGVDVWAASQSVEPEAIFKKDEIRYQLSVINKGLSKDKWSPSETKLAKKLSKELMETSGAYEHIRGSVADCVRVNEKTMVFHLPFVYQAKNYDERLKELLGKITYYKLQVRMNGIRMNKIQFKVLTENEEPELQMMIEELNKE